MTYRYKMSSTKYSMSLRAGHTVYENRLETIAQGTIMRGNVLWTADADGNNVKRGDHWLHVLDAAGRAVDGWVAVVHLGQLYCDLIDVSPPPVPDPGQTPPPDEVQFRWLNSAGQVVVTQEYVKK